MVDSFQFFFLQADSNSTARYVMDHLPPYGLYFLLVMMAVDPCGNYDEAIIITGWKVFGMFLLLWFNSWRQVRGVGTHLSAVSAAVTSGAQFGSCPSEHLEQDRCQRSQWKSSHSDFVRVWVRSLASAAKICIYVVCYITIWCLKMSATTHF